MQTNTYNIHIYIYIYVCVCATRSTPPTRHGTQTHANTHTRTRKLSAVFHGALRNSPETTVLILRLINRFALKTMFSGFLSPRFFAASPIRRSMWVKATTNGSCCCLGHWRWSEHLDRHAFTRGWVRTLLTARLTTFHLCYNLII